MEPMRSKPYFGAHGEEETPVPIPNTEVKHILVDDTGSIRAGKVG